MRPQRILIIRFSSIGDIVLTTPLVRALKTQLGAEVHYLTKASFRAVLAHNPYVDRLWLLEDQLGPLIRALRQQRFTAVIDLHHNLRSLRVKASLWPTPARSFDKLNFRKWLLTRWKIDRLPKVHIVDRYLATARDLGVSNDGQGLDYFVAPTERVSLQARTSTEDSLVDHASYAITKQPVPSLSFTALVTGAAHATKRLPEHQLLDLCRLLSGPVVLLGGPAEAEQGERLAEASPWVINSCGRLTLNQSADLVRQARVVITHDTGLMHIAAAYRRPIVSVWGNTVPEFGMYPYYPVDYGRTDKRMEVEGLTCRPCSKIGYAACPLGHFKCMEKQRMAAVVAAVDEVGK